MSENMDITVIIVRTIGAKAWRQLLRVWQSLNFPHSVSWEVLVVDNNSKDQTRQVLF